MQLIMYESDLLSHVQSYRLAVGTVENPNTSLQFVGGGRYDRAVACRQDSLAVIHRVFGHHTLFGIDPAGTITRHRFNHLLGYRRSTARGEQVGMDKPLSREGSAGHDTDIVRYLAGVVGLGVRGREAS